MVPISDKSRCNGRDARLSCRGDLLLSNFEILAIDAVSKYLTFDLYELTDLDKL